MMKAKNVCKNCKFLRKAPSHSNYHGAYGWCYAPLPLWVNPSIPLVLKKSVKTDCAAFKVGIFEENGNASV